MSDHALEPDHSESVEAGAVDALSEMNRVLPSLARYGLHNRRMIRLLLVSLAFDILLTVGLGFSAVQSHDASVQALAATGQVYERCLAGNVYRQNDKALWNHLLGLTPTSKQTAAQKAATASFRAYIDKTDAPVKCKRS